MDVLNKRDVGNPLGSVYIGRPSKWGNPFVIGRDGDRDEVVRLYHEWAIDRFEREELEELRGRDLVCWCAPLLCHGDVLKKMVEEL